MEKEITEKLQTIENLLILQLIQGGATAKQIETVLKIKQISPTNISQTFPLKELKNKNDKK